MSSPAPTKLAHYRVLSPHAGVHVSPLALGAMSIGDSWEKIGLGKMNKENSFKLLDAYFDKGGNFIDTANAYQDETSEKFIGEWAEKRGIRNQLFIATKYTSDYTGKRDDVQQKALYLGNNAKSLHMSIDDSLEKLRTTYIDLLYVHWWDWDTSIEEIMRSLHTLVLARKVIYLGISDSPAWVVAKANQYARDHALTPFVVYQGRWNVLDRAFERDIIPMARSEGLALSPWGVVGQGKFRTDAEEEQRRATGENGRTVFSPNWERTEKEKLISNALEKVAKEVGTKYLTAVAIAYVMHKAPYVFPIVGGRKVEHLEANIEGLSISLTEEQIKFLESVTEFDIGFPLDFIGDGTGPSRFFARSAKLESKPQIKPLPLSSD